MALYTGDDKLTQLSEDFDRAVFFDAPLIAAAGAVKEASPNADAQSALDDFLKKERKDFSTNMHVRILQEVLDAPASPLFLAYIHGKKYPPAILEVDPLDREPTELAMSDGTKGGVWYSAAMKAAYDKGTSAVLPHTVTADHYTIDTTFVSGREISGTTTISFVANRNGRVVALDL